jgi:enamine deaminase RidA (YjgF/YER057c/UK114 family)
MPEVASPARQYFDPPTLYKSKVYTQAVRSGNMVFIAGQCASDPNYDVPSMDPHDQARLCYQNVRSALEAAGASMRHVVKINTYSTLAEYRKILMDVRKEFFQEPYPPSTGVVVTSLAKPEFLYEVEVVAIVDD